MRHVRRAAADREAVLGAAEQDIPGLAGHRGAAEGERDRGRAGAVGGDGAADATRFQCDGECHFRQDRAGGAVNHHQRAANRDRQHLERGDIGVDLHRQRGRQRLERTGAGVATDLEVVGPGTGRAGRGKAPGVAVDQGAGQYRGSGGAGDLVDPDRRRGGAGLDREAGLEGLAFGIDDSDDAAVGGGGVALRLGALGAGQLVDLRRQPGRDAAHRQRHTVDTGDHAGGDDVFAADRHLPGVALDRGAAEGQQRGGGAARVDAAVGDAQGVGAGGGLHVDGLHFGHRRHAQPGQGGAAEDAVGSPALGAAVDIQRVVAGAADQGQECLHAAEQVGRRRSGRQVGRRIAADAQHVVAGAGVDGGVAGDRLHVDGVGAGAAGDVGRAGVGRQDMELVGPRAKLDVEHLQVAVDDAARQDAAADRGVAAHAEAGEMVGAQETFVVGRAVAVVDSEGIDLRRLVDPGVEVDRAVEIVVAGRRGVELAALDDRGLAHRRHLDVGGESLAGEVGDHHPVAGRRGGEGDHAAADDAHRQFMRHVGQGVARLHHVGVGGREGGIVNNDGPHLAFEQRDGLACRQDQVDQGGACLDAVPGLIRKLEVEAIAVDDGKCRPLGDGGEGDGGVDVDRRRQRLDHVGRLVAGRGGVGVLGGGLADPQQRGVGLTRDHGRQRRRRCARCQVHPRGSEARVGIE